MSTMRCPAPYAKSLRTRRRHGSDIPDCIRGGEGRRYNLDSQCNWLMNMAPYWLVRLNDLLAWLNPALGLVAAVLALLTIAAAAERFPQNAVNSAAYTYPAPHSARPVNVRASAECARPVLPAELRDLRLYD